MIFNIIMYDGSEIEVDGAPDPTGITYQDKGSGIILPDEDPNEMKMVLIPWAAISRVEYIITPDMITPDPVDSHTMNRKARRAGLQ
jgi:hypothetical protein